MKDEEKFNDWWHRLRPALQNTLARLVGAESQDILQDVSIMAVTRFSEFGRYEDFRRWAFKRANWLALDELARRRRFVDDVGEIVAGTVGSGDEPDREHIRSLVDRLPLRQQQVTLDLLDGFTTKEVARRHDIAVATVRSLWRHAKQRLIALMEQ